LESDFLHNKVSGILLVRDIMIIRKFTKKRFISLKWFLACIVIIILIILLFKFTDYIRNIRNNGDIFKAQASQIWNFVKIQWKLSVNNNFPNYTHAIVDENWNKYGLKTASINLNEYLGRVEILWRIENDIKWLLIVDVETVKIPTQSLIIKNNRYFFTKDMLYLDFSQQPQLKAVKSDNGVNVVFNSWVLFNVERFLCSKIFKKWGCETLIEDYWRNKKDTFDSYRWYRFYKHGTWIWTTFDWDAYAYLFKDVEDNNLLDISNMIRLVNKDFVLDTKYDIIKSKCKNSKESMSSVSSSKMKDLWENLISIDLIGKTNVDNYYDCKIVMDVWNERNVNNSDFQINN